MGWYDYFTEARRGSSLPAVDTIHGGATAYQTAVERIEALRDTVRGIPYIPPTPDPTPTYGTESYNVPMPFKVKDRSVNVAAANPKAVEALHTANDTLVSNFGTRYQLRVTSASERSTKHSGSGHYAGTTFDLTPRNKADLFNNDVFSAIVDVLSSMGFVVKDERKRSGPNWTAPHLHVQYKG